MTNPIVKVLVGIAAVAGLGGFLLDLRKQKRIRELVARIKAQDSATWSALAWHQRVLIPRGGLSILFKRATVNDPESLRAYAALQRVEKRQLALIVLAAVAIALVIIGTRYWGWSW